MERLAYGVLAAGVVIAGAAGLYFASGPERVPPAVSVPNSDAPTSARAKDPEPAPALTSVPVPVSPVAEDISGLAAEVANAHPAESDQAAARLAEMNSAESVHALVDAIAKTSDWHRKGELATHLRAVSDPDTLSALLPALLGNYGRGSTVLGELVDAIARLAQPETVDALAALHWQAANQAGQGHKILRAVAAIRNPPAIRGLERLVSQTDSPALAAAAQEALKNLSTEEPSTAPE